MGFTLNHSYLDPDDEEQGSTVDTPVEGTTGARESDTEELAEVRHLPGTDVEARPDPRPTVAGEARESAVQTWKHLKNHDHTNLRPPALRDMAARIDRDETRDPIPAMTAMRHALDRLGLGINAAAYLFAWCHRRAGRLVVALPIDVFLIVTAVRVIRDGWSALPL